LPELNFILDEEYPEISLTETVMINDAMNDQEAETAWSDAMASEFDSLQMKNTGLLVPRPEDDKIIGRMWLRVYGATIGTGAHPGAPSHWEEHGSLGRRRPGTLGSAKNCCGGLSFIVFEAFYFFFQGFIHLFY
jgi:hypothetical protein